VGNKSGPSAAKVGASGSPELEWIGAQNGSGKVRADEASSKLNLRKWRPRTGLPREPSAADVPAY